MRQSGPPPHATNIQKISVMQDRFQLRVSDVESTVETGDTCPVYYQTQKADDLQYLFSFYCAIVNFFNVSIISTSFMALFLNHVISIS